MFKFGKSKEEKELKELYELAQAETEEFSGILYMLQEYNVGSIAELIRKQPREAYVNGILHNYDEGKVISEEESETLANEYFNYEIECVEEILDDIKELNGNYEETRELMAGILNYCKNNKK